MSHSANKIFKREARISSDRKQNLKDLDIENQENIPKYKSFPKCGTATLYSENTTPKSKSSRKSEEDYVTTTPKSSHMSSRTNNNLHPPLNGRPSNPATRSAFPNRSAIRNGTSKLPSTPVVPKMGTRTPRGTPLDTDSGSQSISSITKKSKVRVSTDESPLPKYTPMSANISVTLTSPSRKSLGSAQKNVRCSLRRSSGARRSASHNLYCKSNAASSLNNTPSNLHQRLSYQGTWNTPTSQSEPSSLRKSDIHHSSTLNFWDIERKEDESTNVSVGVRVRPINSRERHNTSIQNIIEMSNNEVTVHSVNGAIHSFNYDHCLWSCDASHPNYASQEQVYLSMAKPLLVHAYEGYNVCLFAYGQTGSGKSYCIMGEDDYNEENSDLSEQIGVIPRFCRELFAEASDIHSRNEHEDIKCQVAIEISYIEIYNEKIYDLVGSQTLPSGEEEQRVIGDKRDPLKIREHPQYGPYVVGASCHMVTSYQDLETWISLGNKQRSIAATGMNDKSSRSHSVFSIKVTQRQFETIEGEPMEHSLESLINLVDLAGSERVAAAYSEGDRLKEGVCINKSLLTLGKVITALAESGGKRKVFIPYRESTLTWLLKESLGGNSKTTMIATISPCNIHQEETLSTLRYAQQVRKIVNWNRINEDSTSKIIRALKLEVDRLRSLQACSPLALLVDDAKTEREDSVESEGSGDQESDVEETERQRFQEREIIRVKEHEISLLKDKLKMAQEQYSERAKLWEDRLTEAELRKKETLERCRMKGLALKLEANQPMLVNLCEDPQLSQTLLYTLKEGSTTFGTSNADVTLSALHKTDTHCSILHEGEKLVLHPKPEMETYVNGKLVTVPTQVFHNDRIVLSGIYFFRVAFPTSSKEKSFGIKEPGRKFDFFFSRDELLKEQEERIREEMSAQQAASRIEMMRELEEQRLELRLQELALKDDVQLLSSELEEERGVKEEVEMARLRLQEEKRLLELRVNHINEMDDADSYDRRFSPSPADLYFRNMESIFNESVQIIESKTPSTEPVNVDLWFMVVDARNICSKLQKPFEFQQQPKLKNQGLENVITVHDLEHNLSASLNASQMKEVLNILRDMVSGEQDDDSLLETMIPWERDEEVSSIPGIRFKMKENIRRLSISQPLNSSLQVLNASLNASISNQMSAKMNARRRSSITKGNLKSVSTTSKEKQITPINVVGNSSSCAVARSVSKVILNFKPPKDSSPFIDVTSHLQQLHDTLKKFMRLVRDPLCSASFSGDDLSEQILELAFLTQSLCSSLSVLGGEEFPLADWDKVSDLQNNINSFGPKITRKLSRMMQGIEKEVDTLVEEESSGLLLLILEVVEEVGFLNLIVSFDLPQGSALASALTICQSYLVGVSRGLEWEVEVASKTAENSSSLMARMDNSSVPSHHASVNKCASQALTKVSAFLGKFSQLKVQPLMEPSMNDKDSTNEANRFLVRVVSASRNVQGLTSAMTALVKELKALQHFGSIQNGALTDAICSLQEVLSELVDDAGLGSAFERKRRFSDTEDADLFMVSLHSLTMKMFRQLDTLRSAVTHFQQAEKIATPSKASDQNGGTPSMKPALKQRQKSSEKKVRFDVSMSASFLEGSFQD